MLIKVRKNQGMGAFRDFISLLVLKGMEIIRMQHEGQYEILTVVPNRKGNSNWIKTVVIQEVN